MIAFTVLGQCASKSNSRVHTGRGRSIKSPAAQAFCLAFGLQVPRSAKRALGSRTKPLVGYVTVYYQSMRSDVDVELVWDCLQKAGVVANDRYIREKHIIGRIDKKNPRVEIQIEEMR